VGAIVGALGMTAVLVFASSFGHLASTPRLYGWSFDAVVFPNVAPQQRSSGVCGDVDTAVARDPPFASVASVCTVNTEIDGRPVTAWSFTPLRGSIPPTIVDGRAPTTADEIALGASTMHALHRHIGNHVRIAGTGGSQTFTVVGQVVLPSPASIDPQPLADGAVITGAAMRPLRSGPQQGNADFHLIVRLAKGVSLEAARHDATGLAQFTSGKAQGPVVPVEIERIRRVRRLPAILGGFLAILAAIAIAHALFTTAWRRRHDLAVLRTLGFTPRQVRASIAWQATTLGAVGLLVGVPIGIVVGRAVWRLVADGLGVSTTAVLSPFAIALLAIATLVLVNLIGAVAAAGAVRESPAAALATE
jgi:predicted lysophospholipase L1 biosynthesis ABC-type transport system permease subunit